MMRVNLSNNTYMHIYNSIWRDLEKNLKDIGYGERDIATITREVVTVINDYTVKRLRSLEKLNE